MAFPALHVLCPIHLVVAILTFEAVVSRVIEHGGWKFGRFSGGILSLSFRWEDQQPRQEVKNTINAANTVRLIKITFLIPGIPLCTVGPLLVDNNLI